MAWSTPRTWVSTEIVTASIMNTHVRDQFNETGPAVVGGSGRILVGTGANSITGRLAVEATVATSQTTTSTSYTDLATAGPTLTTLVTGTAALIIVSAFVQNNTAGSESVVGVDVSGASTIAPSDTHALRYESGNANDFIRMSVVRLYTTLTAGGNTFTAKYRVSGGTGTFANRTIIGYSLS